MPTKLQMLDQTDKRILGILQTNNRVTNLQLAEKVNLSPPTCLKRVRRLRKYGVISGDVSLIDPDAVGLNLFAFVEVTLEQQSEPFQTAFKNKMRTIAEVTQCYMVSGNIDFLIVVQVSEMSEYHQFVQRALTNDPNVRKFQSMFALDRVKFQTAIYLTK